MAKGNDIDLENISMKKWKCEKKRVNKRKTKIIMGGYFYVEKGWIKFIGFYFVF